METLEVIRKKINSIKSEEKQIQIKTVLIHIEQAEKFLKLGINESESQFFTDVIYGTNQAFEGILKEAYTIISEKNAERKTPNDIEQYFINNSILHSRVLDLFTKYRTEWRNPSTHDYKLFFTEEEAYLAILSVTSFINVLLNQILEKMKFLEEQEILKNLNLKIISNIENYSKFSLLEKVEKLFKEFTDYLEPDRQVLNEAELLGILDAYLISAVPSIELIREPMFTKEKKAFRPDFLLKFKSESLIVEVKKEFRPERNELIKSQLSNCLSASKIDFGLGYFFSASKKEYLSERSTIKIDNRNCSIIIIYPK